jgi:prepilin-type N-terminal cleavage/methylation domain-containing protein
VKQNAWCMCRNKKRGRLAAFTLIELTVVLAISAILMAAVFYSFHFLNRQYYSFTQKLHEREQNYRFEQQLRKDFAAADYVQDGGQRLQMVFPNRVVHYHFYRDFILREQAGRQDTLFLGLLHYQLNELETSRQELLVKGLEVELQNQEGEGQRLVLSRSYTSAVLLNGIQEEDLWQE